MIVAIIRFRNGNEFKSNTTILTLILISCQYFFDICWYLDVQLVKSLTKTTLEKGSQEKLVGDIIRTNCFQCIGGYGVSGRAWRRRG